MTDKEFMQNQSIRTGQPAFEDDAIQYLQDTGVYPDPDIDNYPPETDDDYEPTDDEVMSSFGTKWHDRIMND